MHLAPSISQYWDTENVPAYIDDLLRSFRERNPDLCHRVFNESQAEAFIAERFGPREAAAFRACAVPSMQSDYFRYCSVLALGGIYADADYRCVRSLQPFLDRLDRGEIFLGPTMFRMAGLEAMRVWSAFFAFGEPGHPFLRLALDIATANVEARIPERVWPVGTMVIPSIWCTVGPGVFTMMRFMRDWGSFDTFRKCLSGSPAEPFAELYCDVVGDYDRVHEVFDGVRVSSFEEMSRWVVHPVDPIPYKETDVHWHNVTTRIFR